MPLFSGPLSLPLQRTSSFYNFLPVRARCDGMTCKVAFQITHNAPCRLLSYWIFRIQFLPPTLWCCPLRHIQMEYFLGSHGHNLTVEIVLNLHFSKGRGGKAVYRLLTIEFHGHWTFILHLYYVYVTSPFNCNRLDKVQQIHKFLNFIWNSQVCKWSNLVTLNATCSNVDTIQSREHY